MKTQRYETLLLARTETTDDELSMIEQQLDKIFTQANGALSSFDKWGKYQLAYPVNKNSYGIYLLARYEVPKDGVATVLKEVDSFLKIKCNEIILRHLTVKLDASAPVAYQRPDSMDTSRTTSGLDTLKEQKIEQLLDSVESSTNNTAKASSVAESSSSEHPSVDAAEQEQHTEQESSSPESSSEETASKEAASATVTDDNSSSGQSS